MSNFYKVIPSSTQAISVAADTIESQFPGPKEPLILPGANASRFNGWGKTLLLALACYLTIVASGCGAGVVESLGGGLVVSPGAVNFGSVTVGQESDSSVTVQNSSSSAIVVSQVSISGQTFSVVGGSAMPTSIPAGGSYALKVAFKPASATNYSGQLSLMDASAQPLAQVPMQGQGASQSAPQLIVNTANLSFGSIPVNTSITQSLTLTSSGTSPVTVNSATIAGTGFTIVGSSLPATLNPAQTLTLQVQFNPIASGTASGQITISSNSSSNGTATVALGGTGTVSTAPQATPQLVVSSSSLSFGSVVVNSATTQSLVLTSTGTAPVTVSSTAITGAGFAIVGGTLPTTLNPTQSITLQVQFLPTTAGTATGQITISSNSSTGSPAVVALNGTSTTAPSPQLAVSAMSLSFGSVTVDTATTQSLTLTSIGTSPVTVNSAAITGTGFTVVGGSLPATLNPTQSMTLQVQFLPTTAGTASGQITISSNSSSGSTAVVALTGTSTTAPSPQLTVSAASLSFGSVTVNTATTQSLTLRSTGTSAVTVSSAAVTGAGFTIIGGTLPATLNPTQSMTLQVQFLPTVIGSASGQITIASDSSSGSTNLVTLSGTSTAAPSPQLAVSAASLSFGSVTVNTATTQSLTLTSTGTSPVTVNSASIMGAGFTIVGGTVPATLSPTQSITVQVQFLPTTVGSATGQLTIGSNSSTGSTTVVVLSATSTTAPSPQLTVSAASLSFGSVTVNTATTQSLTLTSSGTSPVTVNSASIVGASFTLVGGTLPVTLNPTQSLTLQVQFLPATTGSASGQITIGSNSSTGATTVVGLSGTSTTAPSPQLAVSAASLSFGSVTVGTPTTQSLTLTSTGTSPVTVNSATITGAGFTIVGGNLPATLNPSQSTTLEVQFLPTAAGSANGQITINSNSSTGTTVVVALSGTGTTAPSPQLAVSAASLSFGSVTVNTAATQSLTLTSTGTAPVTVNSATISGTGFTITGSSLPVTLNPSQSITLQVQFLPTKTGSAAGQVTISSNSSTGSTAMVTLNGTGAAVPNPQLTLSTTSLGFGSVPLNTATTLALTLTSTGTSPVTVNSAAISGSGFTIVAASLPVTLNPTQSVTLQVQFKPTAAGALTGQITIGSDSTTGGSALVSLIGTGTAANPQLTLSATSLSFGSVAVNTPTTLTLTLTSTGTTAVTVNSAAISGAGFTTVGGSFPITLNPTQTLTLQVQFDPTTAGAATGQLTIGSTSTTGSTAIVALSGTGTSVPHEVDLSWNAPTSSPDPVAGYNIYRATGSGTLTQINSSPDTSITYVDTTVVSGTAYSYVVKSVDSSGVESVASNEITVTIP